MIHTDQRYLHKHENQELSIHFPAVYVLTQLLMTLRGGARGCLQCLLQYLLCQRTHCLLHIQGMYDIAVSHTQRACRTGCMLGTAYHSSCRMLGAVCCLHLNMTPGCSELHARHAHCKWKQSRFVGFQKQIPQCTPHKY